MKRFLLLWVLLGLLCGCAQEPVETRPAQTQPTEIQPTETTQPPEAKPAHSELYIPGVSVDDVIVWFHEVCLDSEYTSGGDPSRVQKWEFPIRYWIYGEPTAEDMDTFHSFVDWMDDLEGFPGIVPADSMERANLKLYFTDGEGLAEIMGDRYAGLDGAVTFWYLDDAIYIGKLCVRTDLDQDLRNSVLLEEMYNGLGPIQDTLLRPDSIIYQEYSEPQELTEVDELLLKLLYHPDIRCGMDAAECEAVIRSLYY